MPKLTVTVAENFAKGFAAFDANTPAQNAVVNAAPINTVFNMAGAAPAPANEPIFAIPEVA